MTRLTELFTPRKNSQIRYATYDGFEGYVAASDDLMILFRTRLSDSIGEIFYARLADLYDFVSH